MANAKAKQATKRATRSSSQKNAAANRAKATRVAKASRQAAKRVTKNASQKAKHTPTFGKAPDGSGPDHTPADRYRVFVKWVASLLSERKPTNEVQERFNRQLGELYNWDKLMLDVSTTQRCYRSTEQQLLSDSTFLHQCNGIATRTDTCPTPAARCSALRTGL